ncbi:MAG: hypothetical protein ABL983_02405 [Nitrospira sp.]
MQTHTIWGPRQTSTMIADGIERVTTASHGGFILSTARVHDMPAAFPRHQNHSYEEDTAWCFVTLAFPQYFDARDQDAAQQTCKDCFPDVWETWTGTTLSLTESSTKRTDAWDHDHRDEWLVITAWGDWHSEVPKGSVAVRARQGGREANHGIPDQYYLVPADEYRGARLQFVIDRTRHRRIDPLTRVA